MSLKERLSELFKFEDPDEDFRADLHAAKNEVYYRSSGMRKQKDVQANRFRIKEVRVGKISVKYDASGVLKTSIINEDKKFSSSD